MVRSEDEWMLPAPPRPDENRDGVFLDWLDRVVVRLELEAEVVFFGALT